jgi:pimeloyl-ACP methyl ester carboxylesterase
MTQTNATSATTPTIRDQQFVTLGNGTRLHYASAGEQGAPLMLFLHGFPEFWYEWHAQLAEFGTDHFAVAPDLRGFNLSDMPEDLSAYKARHIIDDLERLIAHLGYASCVLVAHDWGGAIAWALALAKPQLLKRLIIINAPHPYLFLKALAHDPAQQKASDYMNWLRAEGSEAALAKDDFKLLEGFFVKMGKVSADWFDGPTRERYHAAWKRGLQGGVNYYRATPAHPPTPTNLGPLKMDLRPEDFTVTVPTRVIWGEADIALPATLLDGLEEVVNDLQVQRIAEGSHWVIHEQPERVNRLIRGFLP